MKSGIGRVWGALLLCGASLSTSPAAHAREDEPSGPIAPIKIEEAAVSGLGLPPREIPDKPGKEFYQKRLYRG